MLESSMPRVVVLGRAGDAQQQLQQALDAIGAQTLATGEIDQLDPEQMRDAHPDVILVSVDERTDDASLDRWQSLFDAPGTTVVFDDADVTSHLSGWDLARWARHLAAKVLGRHDVLPPIQADAERLPVIALQDAHPVAGQSGVAMRTADAFALDLDESVLTMHPAPADSMLDPVGDIDFAALSSQFEAEQQRATREDIHAQAAPTLDELLKRESSTPDSGGSASPHMSDAAIPGVAASASSSANVKSHLVALELTPLGADHAPAKSASRTTDATIDLSSYALEPLQVVGAVSTAATGVIAIVAGLGGPDAVRQLLAGLPATLPVPVLLWQHLDAGKHDRLAQQLAKASPLPVYLAQPGALARPGSVAVMTAGVGVKADSEGWWFKAVEGGIAAALESALGEATSMVMVLSGADGSVVEVAAAHATRGSAVCVQTPDSCFDGAAAAALSMRGMTAASAAQLAALASAQWSDLAPDKRAK